MNHCRRCDSDYEKPGTCNCFAERAPREAAPSLPCVPWIPYVPPALYPPTYPYTPYPWGGTITVYGNHDAPTPFTTSGAVINNIPAALSS